MVTEKSVKELENSQIALTMTVDAASIEKAYAERLAKYSKTIEMPGFRKGRVPASVVERKFGEAIREESTFDALEEHLKETLDTLELDQKPLPYSTPVLQDEETLLPFKKDSDVTFTVVYDALPKIALPAYTGLEVEVPEVEVTDADVEEEVNALREQNALVRSKSGKAEDGDIITLDIVELDENDKEVEGTKREDFTFTIGSGYNFYKLDNDVTGLEKDAEKVIEKTYAEEDGVPGYAGKTVKISVKVKELKRRELPVVDDDFAQDVKDEYKTVADLKAGLRAKLEKNVEEKSKNDKAAALMAKISADCPFAVPASMIDMEVEQSWNKFVNQSGMPEEQLMAFFKMQNQTKEGIMAEWREPAEKNLREQLILEEIKKKEDFALDQEEYEKACEEQLKSIQDENTKEYYKTMIKDDMQFAKVVPFLLENNTFKGGAKVSYKEFMNPSEAN